MLWVDILHLHIHRLDPVSFAEESFRDYFDGARDLRRKSVWSLFVEALAVLRAGCVCGAQSS